MAYRTVVLSGATVQQLTAIQSVQYEADPEIKNYIRTQMKNLKFSENRTKILPEGAPEFPEPRYSGLSATRNVVWNYYDFTLEFDIIHPKGSMVPSLYQFGIWFPVAGKDYQLLEVQVRHEGLSQKLQKLFSKGFGGPEVLMQLFEVMLELLAHIKDENHKHSITIQLSVRMSDNNMIFMDTFEDLHKAIVMIKERMRELYNTDKVDFARAISILDSQVEVPTLIGFPMVVHLNETVVFAMNAYQSWSETGGQKKRVMRSSCAFYDELSAGFNIKVRNYRPGFEYHMRMELTPTSDVQFEKIDGRIMKAKINLPKERKSLMKLTQSTHLIDANGVPKPSNELTKRFRRANAEDSTKCRQLFGINICRTRQCPDNSPIPNLEFYVTNEDPELDSIELTLERPAATATRDQQIWSAKVNAGKRKNHAQLILILKNPKEGTKSVNLILMSPQKTITAESTLFNSVGGNVSKMEFDLKLPNVLDLNSKYNFEQKGEVNNTDLIIEYQCPLSGKETIKWNQKSSFSYKREKKTKEQKNVFLSEFKSTQFPDYNSNTIMSYNFSKIIDRKINYFSRFDFKVEWGPQLQDRIRFIHNSKMDVIDWRPFEMTSENSMIIEATPLEINYDLRMNSEISMIKNKPKLIVFYLVGKDVEGRGRDIKGSLKYERIEQMIHSTNITYNRTESKLIWEFKTDKNGHPWITLMLEFSQKDRSYIILKLIKASEPDSSFEYFYENGVYGATLETKRWSAILDGEKRNDKNFGKLGFVDKVDNYEHKSHFNYSNGILTVKSISDKEKQTFTKLDAIISYKKIISNISLITPKVNAQLTSNPLGEKKTLVVKVVSDKYDHDSNVEWVPRKYLKIDTLSHRKVAPERRVKVDAYLTRQEESTFRMTAPQMDVDIRRVKTPKPKYIFNTTINGYNLVQEIDANPSLTPIQNFMVTLNKYNSFYHKIYMYSIKSTVKQFQYC